MSEQAMGPTELREHLTKEIRALSRDPDITSTRCSAMATMARVMLRTVDHATESPAEMGPEELIGHVSERMRLLTVSDCLTSAQYAAMASLARVIVSCQSIIGAAGVDIENMDEEQLEERLRELEGEL